MVLEMTDVTGSVFGWKGDSLQRAMDSSCMFTACENGNPLKSQNVASMNKCAVKSTVKEDIDGCKSFHKTLVEEAGG
jgi:hypothetical protein